jgi:hypothetical protein
MQVNFCWICCGFGQSDGGLRLSVWLDHPASANWGWKSLKVVLGDPVGHEPMGLVSPKGSDDAKGNDCGGRADQLGS